MYRRQSSRAAKAAPLSNESTEVQLPLSTKHETESCWICLEEGSDEHGYPLRRDCSCRGELAGFAYLSCIIKYAESKTERWDGIDLAEFTKPWKLCSNFNQDHENELALDLASASVAFAEKQY